MSVINKAALYLWFKLGGKVINTPTFKVRRIILGVLHITEDGHILGRCGRVGTWRQVERDLRSQETFVPGS
jgi:hypothetical protein